MQLSQFNPPESQLKSASITFTLNPTATQRDMLLRKAKRAMREFRRSVERKAKSRTRFADYTDVSGHAFAETLQQFGGGTAAVAKLLVQSKYQMGGETRFGTIVESMAAKDRFGGLPLRQDYGWKRLDDDKDLKNRVRAALGTNITKVLDLIDVHDDHGRAGMRVLRLVGMKLNGKTANSSIMKYGSDAMAELPDRIARFTAEEGADRAEIVLGVAYDKSDSQPRRMLGWVAEALGKDWVIGNLHGPCLTSPDGRIRFRVLVGPALGGYLLKPMDDVAPFDLMAVLSQAQHELGGSRTLSRIIGELAEDMDRVAKANMPAFLADPRFAYLADASPQRQRRSLWVSMLTGSWRTVQF